MRSILLLLALATSAFGQTGSIRISPDGAVAHLLNQPDPVYPAFARQTHISGVVVLEIRIDEYGKPSVLQPISGHPLLQSAAITAVKSWKYQPFELDGKPTPVTTLVMVSFGDSGNQAAVAVARAEMQFRHEFWTAMQSAQAALRNKDSAVAAQELKKAEELLARASSDQQHAPERWQWTTNMGHLCLAQGNFDASEKYYKKALELHLTDDKNAPEIAATFASLGNLYNEEKRYDLTHDYMTRSITLYEKNFKWVGAGNPGARERYGRAIAYQSWTLARLASQQNDRAEFSKQCNTVLEFEAFLNTTEHDSIVSTCRQTPPGPAPKN